ncbi:MAG TPA: trypsin-like peptidase domain-containing protein [Actinomycetes bacterium]|nr:trypsin-like peptidase domain-containing protein [Actinomycetes bacterium]
MALRTSPNEPERNQQGDRTMDGLDPSRSRDGEPGWGGVSSWGPGATGASWGAAGSGSEPASPASGAPGPAFGSQPGSDWGAPSTVPRWSQEETRPIPETSGAGPGWGWSSPGSGQRPPGGRRTSRLVAGILVVLLLIGAGFGLGQLRDRGSSDAGTASGGPGIPVAVTPSRVQAGDEPVAAVARVLLPSVVQLETGRGLGSGVIYDQRGYILTAAHVVDGAGGQVTVRLADGTKVNGRVLGTDEGTDIAVVKVERSGLKPAALALGVKLQVGQTAVAIGSPFGLEGSVTSGVVSAVNRSLPAGRGNVFEVIQTDAPINPGNSGGALADREGKVIGINDSIQSQSGGNEGVGFAVPIDIAAASATRIVEGKSTPTGYLGVSGTDPTLGRPGALINEVVSGSPADKAGLQVGDLVVAVNGRQVQSMDDLAAQVRLLGASQRAQLTVVRDGKEQILTATLTNRPNE